MSARSRTFAAVTDVFSAYRSHDSHRRRRVDKKRRARWFNESRLAMKWLRGLHNWASIQVEAKKMQEIFGGEP